MEFKKYDRFRVRGTRHKGTITADPIPGQVMYEGRLDRDSGTNVWHAEVLRKLRPRKKKPWSEECAFGVDVKFLAMAWDMAVALRPAESGERFCLAGSSRAFAEFCGHLGITHAVDEFQEQSARDRVNRAPL